MSRNLVPKLALASLVVFLAYCAWRVHYSGIDPAKLTPLDALILFPAVGLLLANMAIAVTRAYSARSWLWIFLSLMWPVSLVYTLLVNRGPNADKRRAVA